MTDQKALIFAAEKRTNPFDDIELPYETTLYYFDAENEPVRLFTGSFSIDALIWHENQLYFGPGGGTEEVASGKIIAKTENRVHAFAIYKNKFIASDFCRIYEPLSGKILADKKTLPVRSPSFDHVSTMVEHKGKLYFGGYSARAKSGVFKLGRTRPRKTFPSPVHAFASLDDVLYLQYGMIQGAFPTSDGNCYLGGLENGFSYSFDLQIWNMIAHRSKLLCSGYFDGLLEIDPAQKTTRRLLEKYGRIGGMTIVPPDIDLTPYLKRQERELSKPRAIAVVHTLPGLEDLIWELAGKIH